MTKRVLNYFSQCFETIISQLTSFSNFNKYSPHTNWFGSGNSLEWLYDLNKYIANFSHTFTFFFSFLISFYTIRKLYMFSLLKHAREFDICRSWWHLIISVLIHLLLFVSREEKKKKERIKVWNNPDPNLSIIFFHFFFRVYYWINKNWSSRQTTIIYIPHFVNCFSR